MSKHISNLELAAAVYWGDVVDPDDCNLVAQDSPEDEFLFKETLEKLSDDAKLIATTILNMPDEVYHKTGKLIMYEVQSYMERRYKWSKKKVKWACAELTAALGGNNE